MITKRRVIKCPICGEPFNLRSIYGGVCPDCHKKADEKDKRNPPKRKFELEHGKFPGEDEDYYLGNIGDKNDN